ncbi:UTRA domain-containing protein [Streptomyces sp. M10(2022)]
MRRSRRYLLDGKPVLKAVSYLPAEIADGTPIAEVDTGPGGIYARLAELGHAPKFREEIRVRMPSKEGRPSSSSTAARPSSSWCARPPPPTAGWSR